MTETEIIDNKARYIKILRENLAEYPESEGYPGVEALIEYLMKSDFFEAPASTRYHMSEAGGLCKHSLNVYERLIREVESEYGSVNNSPYSLSTITIVSLLHDLCKVNFYKVSSRNVKNEETGKWEKVPYYAIEDQLPIPHSFKSQYIARSYLKLTRVESLAIMSHMGAFDSTVKGGDSSIMKIFEQCPLAFLLHVADMKATNLDEVKPADV